MSRTRPHGATRPSKRKPSATPAYRRRLEARFDRDIEAELATVPTTRSDMQSQFARIEQLKRRNEDLCEVYGPAYEPTSQPATPITTSPPHGDRRPRERREQRHTARSTSGASSGSDPDEPEPPSAGRRCAAPWCDHPVHGSPKKRYCGTERCELSRASERQRKHRAAGLNSDELNQLEEARITHYIGARAFAAPGKHALSYLWRFGLASGEDPGECQAIATLNRACRCNGHHIAGGAVGCFKCGLPRPVRA